MPKNKNKVVAPVVTVNLVAPTPKVEGAGKEVKAEQQPTPLPPASSPASGAKPVFFPLAFLKTSPLTAADLKVGEEYILVKCIQTSPDGHFPTVDRDLHTDIAIKARFLRWEECYALPGGSGLSVEEFAKANETQKASIQASHKLTRMADFDDGRFGFAESVWSTVSENDIPLLVYPNDDEGAKNAEVVAHFMSARAFYLGWQQVIKGLQRETLIRSANVTELFSWLDKQGLGTLRSAAAVYGLNVKATFAKDVDIVKAREAVKAAREKIGNDPNQVARLAKEYTEKRAQWELEKSNLAKHETVSSFLAIMAENGVTGDLGLAQHPFETAAIEAAKKKAEAEKAPKATAASSSGGATRAPRQKKEMTIDEMRKLIAVADAQEKERQEKEAAAAREYEAKVAADKVKREMAEAEAAKAKAAVNVTDNKAKTLTTPQGGKVKVRKAAKLAV